MSLKEPLMYKICPKWLFWVYLDANKHFPKEISLGVKTYHFWEMTPGYEFDVEK